MVLSVPVPPLFLSLLVGFFLDNMALILFVEMSASLPLGLPVVVCSVAVAVASVANCALAPMVIGSGETAITGTPSGLVRS